jgi:hypothetical protein
MPTQAPRNGTVSVPVKRAAAKSPKSLPKPKPATARVAAISGRQIKMTSSVRALPRASEPTAKLPTLARPVVTKAAASQPRVVLPPPKKQPAPIVPRTTLPVPVPAKSTLPHHPKVQKRPAQATTQPAKPALKAPKNLRLVRVEKQTIDTRWKLATKNRERHCCSNYSDPAHGGRDPVLRFQKNLPQCRLGREALLEGESEDSGYIDNPHIWGNLSPATFFEELESFFKPCRSSRQIQNRSSAAPKTKTARFANALVSEYRCIPACLGQPWYFKRHGESVVYWEPSKEELEGFKANE